MKGIVFFDELENPDISLVGGKAANLCILTANGFPVPFGFCLATGAYKDYITANKLQDQINKIMELTKASDIDSLEYASKKIRNLFLSGVMPQEIAEGLRNAYDSLQEAGTASMHCPVAVRSSATAEDLPDMSFAGQQDTYLNVRGFQALQEAVVQCWSSLWTARAIGYRMKNGISQSDIALAVAVQTMVNSDVSGVMFTANPLTGKRTETVIDAAFGLGEALVSGQVQPDHYIYDQLRGAAISKEIGGKKTSVRPQENGGVTVISENASNRQALTDNQIKELAETGQQIADLYMSPQDVEWAYHDNRLYILQSRPITSLYPTPEGLSSPDYIKGPPKAYFSFASWQVMTDPITPLGRDYFCGISSAVSQKLGYNSDILSQNVFITAGERLYVSISPLIKNNLGRSFLEVFLSSLDKDAASVVEKLSERSEFGIVKSHMPFIRRIKMMSIPARMAFNALRILMNPASGRKRYEKRVSSAVSYLRQNCDSMANAQDFTDFIINFMNNYAFSLLLFLPTCVMAGQIPLQFLTRFASKLPGGEAKAYEITRGLPNNPTTEMDLNLWTLAKSIKCSKESFDIFKNHESSVLADLYLNGKLPHGAQSGLDGFLGAYGIRGIAEIDLGRPRWSDDPTHIMQVIKSYLEIDKDDQAPDKVFARSAGVAEKAARDLVNDMKKISHNPLKIALVRFFIRRTRELAGLRELPKFSIVKILKPLRDALRRFGGGMADEGLIEQPDDIFFLHLTELQKVSHDLKEIIKQRKLRYEFEKRRRSIPKIILNDGTAFYEGSGLSEKEAADDGSIIGNPVSAGIVEGIVRVVLDPHKTRLLPGEILVCPATDPAWTPLFLVASGLVAEIGGMMTHGSVIAREYGIPAVVGVSKATTLLKTGQKIRLNGNNGRIELLD